MTAVKGMVNLLCGSAIDARTLTLFVLLSVISQQTCTLSDKNNLQPATRRTRRFRRTAVFKMHELFFKLSAGISILKCVGCSGQLTTFTLKGNRFHFLPVFARFTTTRRQPECLQTRWDLTVHAKDWLPWQPAGDQRGFRCSVINLFETSFILVTASNLQQPFAN